MALCTERRRTRPRQTERERERTRAEAETGVVCVRKRHREYRPRLQREVQRAGIEAAEGEREKQPWASFPRYGLYDF